MLSTMMLLSVGENCSITTTLQRDYQPVSMCAHHNKSDGAVLSCRSKKANFFALVSSLAKCMHLQAADVAATMNEIQYFVAVHQWKVA